MIETFIAGTALALACFWMLKYGHIVIAGALVLAAVLGGWAYLSGTVAPPTGGTVLTTVGVIVIGIVFAVM